MGTSLPKMIYAVPNKIEASMDLSNLEDLTLDELLAILDKITAQIKKIKAEKKKKGY
jgi:hypothetical protein